MPLTKVGHFFDEQNGEDADVTREARAGDSQDARSAGGVQDAREPASIPPMNGHNPQLAQREHGY